ncbi:MAG: toprim domain-containing protein, partial [Actinomycetota bacterium]|nr:toprim domain-containing protein [Actinomycetota bacterium]
LSTDLLDDDRFSPGYAPAGWTHLVDHLRRHGATDEEIVATGLAMYASNGRIIDRFRDRLTFPIHGPDGEIHGFIGRRNPERDEDEKAGPKYLNTANNDLFGKGDQLFGLHEARQDLAAGATPVLVEGPVDAVAVTLACDGQGVGVAPLGTAFTDRQADQLRPYIGPDRPGVVVATDADPAGERAAEPAYWQLTARGDNPRRLVMDEGLDPAAMLQADGREELLEALMGAGSLAGHLVDQRIAEAGPDGTAAGQALTIRAAAEVIGALPPPRWLEHIDHVTQVLDAPPGSVHLEVIDAGTAWVLDPAAQARDRLNELGRSPRTVHGEGRQPAASAPDSTPTQRWEELVISIDPRLPTGDDWPLLADAISRADAAGYDVAANLPGLAGALPDRRPASELYWRLVDDCEAAAPRRPTHGAADVYVPDHDHHPDEPAPGVGRGRGQSPGPSR